MMKLIVLAALCLAAAVSAQKPCCAPDQFMGGNGLLIGQDYPGVGAQAVQIYQFGAWDFKGRRLGVDSSITTSDGYYSQFRLVQDYSQGLQWVIFDEFKYCEKQPAPRAEPTNCLPDNSSMVFSGTIGGADGVKFDSYTYEARLPESGNIEGQVTVNAVRDSCLPVGSSFIGTYFEGSQSIKQVVNAGWVDVVPGIAEPKKWFDLPSYCNQAANIAARPYNFPTKELLRFASVVY